MGHTTPLIPVDVNSHFHSNSRFKFTFSSDSSGTDVGYWFDDFVIVYDQSARTEEYNLDVSGVFTDGSIPGSWGKIRLELTNTVCNDVKLGSESSQTQCKCLCMELSAVDLSWMAASQRDCQGLGEICVG